MTTVAPPQAETPKAKTLKVVVNQCVICGRFKKWEELVSVWEPDTDFGPERQWFECQPCRDKENECSSLLNPRISTPGPP